MNQTLSLESVVNQFASWRANRQMREPTPRVLQQQAVTLKSTYPVGKIVIALGINNNALKRWSAKLCDNRSPDFIELPPPMPEDDRGLSESRTICELPNGIRLTFTGSALTSNLLSQIYDLNSGVK